MAAEARNGKILGFAILPYIAFQAIENFQFFDISLLARYRGNLQCMSVAALAIKMP